MSYLAIVHDGFEFRYTARHHDHVGALSGELDGGAAAHALRGTGDQDGLAKERKNMTSVEIHREFGIEEKAKRVENRDVGIVGEGVNKVVFYNQKKKNIPGPRRACGSCFQTHPSQTRTGQ